MAAEICHFRNLEKLSGNDYTGGHFLRENLMMMRQEKPGERDR